MRWMIVGEQEMIAQCEVGVILAMLICDVLHCDVAEVVYYHGLMSQ